MASEKQIAANRRNALKSTGPRTSAGKARASQNAVAHGLLGRATLMQGDDRAAFESLREQLTDRLAPEGALEELLLDQIVASAWRLRRMNQVEAGLLDLEIESLYEDVKPALQPGEAFRRDAMAAGALAKLARYATPIERSLYRALHELQRLQAERRGTPVLPPITGDVSVHL